MQGSVSQFCFIYALVQMLLSVENNLKKNDRNLPFVVIK